MFPALDVYARTWVQFDGSNPIELVITKEKGIQGRRRLHAFVTVNSRIEDVGSVWFQKVSHGRSPKGGFGSESDEYMNIYGNRSDTETDQPFIHFSHIDVHASHLPTISYSQFNSPACKNDKIRINGIYKALLRCMLEISMKGFSGRIQGDVEQHQTLFFHCLGFKMLNTVNMLATSCIKLPNDVEVPPGINKSLTAQEADALLATEEQTGLSGAWWGRNVMFLPAEKIQLFVQNFGPAIILGKKLRIP